MNGQWLGTRKIRTNWATRKGPTNEPTPGTRSRGMNFVCKILTNSNFDSGGLSL
jgi:hypothetical protein